MKRFLLGLALLAACAAVPAKAQDGAVQSDNALAFLTLDFDRTPGWIATVKGGYQWNFFKNAGIKIMDAAGTTMLHSHKQDYTKSGGAASVGLGYNFGPRFPLTVGLEIGVGPSGDLKAFRNFTNATAAGWSVKSHQRVRMYTLDLGADYEFRNCSRWTPFIGAAAGVVLIKDKLSASTYNGGVFSAETRLDNKTRYNFMVGARAGVRYDLNERLTLSLYGSYDYLGTIKGRSTNRWSDPTNPVVLSTQKITLHSVAVKAGLKISF